MKLMIWMSSNMKLYYIIAFLFLYSMTGLAQNIVVEQFQPNIPILVGKDRNPVLKIVLKNADLKQDLKRRMLLGITLDLVGTTSLNDIQLISIHPESKDNGVIVSQRAFASQRSITPNTIINMNVPLSNDSLVLWIAIKLKSKVNLSNKINVKVAKIYTDIASIPVRQIQTKDLNIGYALHNQMDFNSHTARIPALVTTKKGTLISLWDARHENSRDLQGDMDIVIRRSEDHGLSWDEPITVLNMKTFGGLPEKFNGVSDANILVDERSGKIFIVGLWMHGVINPNTGEKEENLDSFSTVWNHQWANLGSQSGFDYHKSSQLIITESNDDGKTWAKPRNLTSQVKKKEWWLLAPAPGAGITLKNGTLLFPSEGRDENGQSFSSVTYSTDGGKTWKTSNPAHKNTNECSVIQLQDGSIMLNMRDVSNKQINARIVAITNDLGETWVEHHTSRKALIESSCMASLYMHNNVMYFMNPNSTDKRDNMTLKVSFDQGNSWPEKYWKNIDQYDGNGYSCISKIDDHNIGVVYEGSQADIIFQIFTTVKR